MTHNPVYHTPLPQGTTLLNGQLMLSQHETDPQAHGGLPGVLKSVPLGTPRMRAAGAIRNPGTGWTPIVDGNHQCDYGVASVETGGTVININFTEPANKRVSAICVPDETLAAKGFLVGASFSEERISIQITRRFEISDYIAYDGTNWATSLGRFTIDSFSGGNLILSHEALPGQGVSIANRSGSWVPCVSTLGSPITDTQTKITIRDWSGAVVASPAAGGFWLSRTAVHGGAIDPNEINTTTFPLHNIWFVVFDEADPVL